VISFEEVRRRSSQESKPVAQGLEGPQGERSFALFTAQEAVEALDVELTVLSRIRSILLITKVVTLC
jgi:hypothetical protein